MVIYADIITNHPEIPLWINFITVSDRGQTMELMAEDETERMYTQLLSGSHVFEFKLKGIMRADSEGELHNMDLYEFSENAKVTAVNCYLDDEKMNVPEDILLDVDMKQIIVNNGVCEFTVNARNAKVQVEN